MKIIIIGIIIVAIMASMVLYSCLAANAQQEISCIFCTTIVTYLFNQEEDRIIYKTFPDNKEVEIICYRKCQPPPGLKDVEEVITKDDTIIETRKGFIWEPLY